MLSVPEYKRVRLTGYSHRPPYERTFTVCSYKVQTTPATVSLYARKVAEAIWRRSMTNCNFLSFSKTFQSIQHSFHITWAPALHVKLAQHVTL